MRFMVSSILLILISIFLVTGCTKQSKEEKPLACVSLLTNDDSFALEIARAFNDTLIPLGYQTQIVFCENNYETQRLQIEKFIENKAKIILVHCVIDGEYYEDLFKKAKDSGCIVIPMAIGNIVNSDVQSIKYSFDKGLAKCEVVKEYLDQQYPDAAPKSVDLLILENLGKTNFIKTCAGMRMIGEKYIRYFDYNSLDFTKEEINKEVYYLDENGNKQLVDEPAGGLILDEQGFAILNPFYDSRVNLKYATSKGISTILDGQQAVDSYVLSRGGDKLRIVISFSGDAAIGANQRLMFYQGENTLHTDVEKLAVFGSDDTETNRDLILKSASGESVYRGFVGYRSVYWEIATMIEMALDDDENNLLKLDVIIGSLNESKDGIDIEYKVYDLDIMDKIFDQWD